MEISSPAFDVNLDCRGINMTDDRNTLSISIGKLVEFQWIAWMGTGVELALLWVLRGKLGVSEWTAGALAIEAALLHNFSWYYLYTWADDVRHTVFDFVRRLLTYNLYTALIDAVTNFGVYVYLVEMGVHYVLAALIGKLIGPVAKYAVNEFLVFDSAASADESVYSNSSN